jgi:3-(3-hydroxy-phenyl)propionate hydroxylase
LLGHVGNGFTLLHFGNGTEIPADRVAAFRALDQGAIPVRTIIVEPRGANPRSVEGLLVIQEDGLVSHRFDALPGTTFLLRPDQHVCARWREFDAGKVQAALARATCNA